MLTWLWCFLFGHRWHVEAISISSSKPTGKCDLEIGDMRGSYSAVSYELAQYRAVLERANHGQTSICRHCTRCGSVSETQILGIPEGA